MTPNMDEPEHGAQRPRPPARAYNRRHSAARVDARAMLGEFAAARGWDMLLGGLTVMSIPATGEIPTNGGQVK
jgi:hypothetical protein